MKLHLYKIIILSVTVLFMQSCKKDFLEVVPFGKQVAVTTSDYDKLMAFERLGQYTGAGGWQAEALMGDEMAAESSEFSAMLPDAQNAFRWEDNIFRETDVDWAARTWMANLYQLNKVINEVMSSTGGTEQAKLQLQAEARASRAWIYFQLINIYGKPYQQSTAGTDPGFPIITIADINAKGFKRGTVQEVYDFITTELTAAIPNLPINGLNGIRFNRAGAKGILGKVYLFMNKNTEALNLLDASFVDNAAKVVPAKLYDYNAEFASGGKFTPMNYNGPNNAPGLDYNDFTESIISRSFYNSSNAGNGLGNNAFVLTPAAQALFLPSDLRLNFYAPEFPYSIPNPSGRLRKYAVAYTQFGLQISELYLLRAEVKAKLNDLSGAKADLEILRKNRMPAADAPVSSAISGNKTQLISYIFDERVREFAMEGYRWFDMRRQSVDPMFSGKVYTHTLYNNDTNTETLFTLRPQRLTRRLPINIMNANPEFVNNP